MGDEEKKLYLYDDVSSYNIDNNMRVMRESRFFFYFLGLLFFVFM